jgi:uncharacterized protein YbcI
MVDDLVVVLLEETFTPAEKTLIARGESEPIQNIRRKFQKVMADQFRSVVEQITGRQVRAFMSETDIESNISAELFLLGGARTDMDAFEAKADDVDQAAEEAEPGTDG